MEMPLPLLMVKKHDRNKDVEIINIRTNRYDLNILLLPSIVLSFKFFLYSLYNSLNIFPKEKEALNFNEINCVYI